MHGGTSLGAPSGKANGNYRSGAYTKETKRLLALVRMLAREAREVLAEA